MCYRNGFEPLIYSTPLYLLINGSFAVFIFFVLSGYVLTYRFFATGDQSILGAGAIRRYFRLLPPIVLSLALTFVVMTVFLGWIESVYTITNHPWMSEYFTHPSDIFDIARQMFWGSFFDNTVVYNKVLWTMNIEFVGSLLVFSFASLFGRTPNRWIFYLGAGLFLLNTYYLPFILGMLLADMYNREHRKTFTINNGGILLFILGAGLFLGTFNKRISYIWIFQDLLLGYHLTLDIQEKIFYSIGAFLLLLALLNSAKLKAALSNRLLSFLGNISFSMYLLHMIIFGSFSSVLFTLLINSLHLPYLVAVCITFPPTIAVVLLSSYIAYRIVDLNGIRLSKRIHETYFTSRQKSATDI